MQEDVEYGGSEMRAAGGELMPHCYLGLMRLGAINLG